MFQGSSHAQTTPSFRRKQYHSCKIPELLVPPSPPGLLYSEWKSIWIFLRPNLTGITPLITIRFRPLPFFLSSHYPGAMFTWSQVNDSATWTANVTCPEFQAFAGLKSNYQKVHSVGCSWQSGSNWVGLPNNTFPQGCKPFHWCDPAGASSANGTLNLILETGVGFTWIGDTTIQTSSGTKLYICGANGTWEEQASSTSTAAQASSTTSTAAPNRSEPLMNITKASTTQKIPLQLVISTALPTDPPITGLSLNIVFIECDER